MDLFHKVKMWEDMVPMNAMVTLYVNDFFPKWHQTLCLWLSNGANGQEVAQWYSGWKVRLFFICLYIFRMGQEDGGWGR